MDDEAHILIIGSLRLKNGELVNALRKRYDVCFVASGKEALAYSAQRLPQALVLDAVSLRTPGIRICQTLRAQLGAVPILHLHPGPKDDAQSCADALLFAPITARRLLYSLNRLLNTHKEETLTCGPFQMNVTRRMLYARGQETQLTPKQTLLLEIFLRHPSQTHSRKTLMEKVWQTDYLGDTRTLDVHIRWLRQVLEHDSTNPQFLKTVRGVGYKLEIGDEGMGEPALELAAEMT
ncbi:MAG: response regulator transcription factor [Chloroflexi bacterium]|nr:response regulator transcription factor [Chloroflexota bacterium]